MAAVRLLVHVEAEHHPSLVVLRYVAVMLELIARGLSNREIATDLFVEESTVRTHVKRIQMKLQLRDRVQIVIFAYETGVNEPAPALGRGPAE